MFIGYPKRTRCGIFYNPKENKVIVSTHATLLEEDYNINFKPKSKAVLEKLDSVQDPHETPNFPPPFPVDVQRGNMYNMYLKVNKHKKQLKTKFKKLKNKKIMKRLEIHLNHKTWIILCMYNNQCSKLVVGG